MPIYEYECANCGRRFDKLQPMTSEPLTVCELCGKGPVRRVLHPAGVIFKGSGWYVTDNRKSSTSSGSAASPSNSGSGGNSSNNSGSSDAGGNSSGESGAKSSSTESTPTTESSKSKSSSE